MPTLSSLTVSKDHQADALADLGAIEVPKSSEVLARRLQDQILNGVYGHGENLPTERELVAATTLSRGSVREALRILEARGLVTTRAGRYGGSVVSRPSDSMLENQISLFARGANIPVRALVETRQALAPMIAFLAASNRTEEDLERLKSISRQLEAATDESVPRFLRLNADWHSALADACHNGLLKIFAEAIAGLMLEVSEIENFATHEVRRLAIEAHQRILDAIEAGDAETARRRAERDVAAYAKVLEATLQMRIAKEQSP
jgi:GntR family transcriptional repressor for pyruvate dehydrogenase complex